MKHWFVSLFLGIVLSTTVSCKRQKTRKSAPMARVDSASGPTEITKLPTIRTPEGTSEKVAVDEVDFTYLVARSKVSFRSKADGIDNADLTLRMKKDSLIWFTAGQFGITGARGRITRDSVTIVDVLHRSYTQLSFPQLSARLGIEVSYDLLQSIIIGSMPWKTQIEQIQKDSSTYVLRQRSGPVQIANYLNPATRKIVQVEASEGSRHLLLSFQDFTTLERFLFPLSSTLTLEGKTGTGTPQQTVVELRHRKVELTNQVQTFPFSIPSRYTRN